MERKNSRGRAVRQGLRRHAAIALGLVGAAGVAACGRSDVLYKDDQYGAHGARGGVGGTAGGGGTGAHPMGGTNVSGGTGGNFTGGTGGKGGGFGTGATGGSFGTGGSGTGGSPVGGRGGAGGAGAQGPYACQHTAPSCDTFTNFSTDSAVNWGSGAFSGGVVVFGNGIARDQATDHIRVTGTVSDYSNGISIYFATCADLSKYAGIYFTISGTTGFNDEIQVQPWTNSDYPWQADPKVMRGGCTAANPMNPYVYCMPPDLLATLYSSRQYAYWSDFSGGAPVSWNSFSSPSEIVGIQWTFPYDPAFGTYLVDVTLDDVGFIRSGSAAPDCGPSVGGMGGMGGMGGVGGVGGFAGSAGSSVGGAGAGGFAGNAFGFGGYAGNDFGFGGFAGNAFGFGGYAGNDFGFGGFAGNDFGSGGFSSGGAPSGGFSSSGAPSGGFSGGGFSSGGFSDGGVPSGGFSSGGAPSGGFSAAGVATGGT